MSGANLSYANLRNTNLSAADLSEVDLTHAYLADANLRHTNLTGANLTGANLTGATMTGAELTNACMRGAFERTRPHHTPVMPSTTDSLEQTIITLQAERDHLAAELDRWQSRWGYLMETLNTEWWGKPEVGRHGKNI